MGSTEQVADFRGTARNAASALWENPFPLYESRTTSDARLISLEGPYKVPYTEEVFQKLVELPDKAPELPYDGDDDL